MYDVIIIGSGISGACIARECARYELKTLVLEKEFDVAMEATQANSAIIHAGQDPIPGTLKAKYNVLGSRMYQKMSEELDIPYLASGGMVVANDEEDIKTIHELYDRGLKNGLKPTEMKILTQKEVRMLEPNISDEVVGALYLPTTAITYPLEAAIANLENAVDNGVLLKTDEEVVGIRKDNHFFVDTKKHTYEAKVVINATGIYAEKISKLIAETNFTIKPRRGEYLVLDKDVNVVSNVIYPTPSTKGKGVLVTPQYHGNVLLGPTSEFVSFDETNDTTSSGIAYIKKHLTKSIKNIPYHKVIRTFAGSRPTPSTKDFILEETNVKGFINVAGIESPGLTAAPAYAIDVVKELIGKRIDLVRKKDFNPYRKKVVRMSELSLRERNELYKKDKRYAKIICRCETVTEGEIVDAIHRNCGARTVTGVKNRVRAGAGRCQGGFCQSEVVNILARELDLDPKAINYSKRESNIIKSETKE
jgi:glycerol-3-phosphate dehydrogenase